MSLFLIIIFCLLLEHVPRILLRDFIEFSFNYGVSFGLFGGSPVFSMILALVSCIFLFCLMTFGKLDKISRVGLAIMLGGALSNLLERIFLGYVIDWIPFPFGLMNLNFNIADIEISLGGLIAFLGFF
ncbi:MAG: signal peptidase II [Synergistaceae bacterium]|nr:signal peptidase II [Synergistaceae bacterium]